MKYSLLYKSMLMLLFVTIFAAFTPKGEESLINEVYDYTNLFRKSKGLGGLVLDEKLNVIAQQHSQNMAAGKVSFGHGGFNNRYKLANSAHPELRYFAENVAYGPTSGKEAVKGWENSDGHRKNMLGKFSLIGIGVAKSKDGTIYYTQIFCGE